MAMKQPTEADRCDAVYKGTPGYGTMCTLRKHDDAIDHRNDTDTPWSLRWR